MLELTEFFQDMSQTGGEICVNPFHYERKVEKGRTKAVSLSNGNSTSFPQLEIRRVRPQLNGIHQLVDR